MINKISCCNAAPTTPPTTSNGVPPTLPQKQMQFGSLTTRIPNSEKLFNPKTEAQLFARELKAQAQTPSLGVFNKKTEKDLFARELKAEPKSTKQKTFNQETEKELFARELKAQSQLPNLGVFNQKTEEELFARELGA